MCLIIQKGQQLLRAEKDITVYKSMSRQTHHARKENIIYSVFQYHAYVIGKLYETTITIEDSICASDWLEGKKRDAFVKAKGRDSIEGVKKGFHSAFSMQRCLDSDREPGEIIVECIVPKGSLYYVGIDEELLASNAIIIKRIVPEKEYQRQH